MVKSGLRVSVLINYTVVDKRCILATKVLLGQVISVDSATKANICAQIH